MEQERTAVMELQSSLSKLNISLDRSKEKIAAHDQEIKHVKHELNTIQTSERRSFINTINRAKHTGIMCEKARTGKRIR
jgi:hypothetical protein